MSGLYACVCVMDMVRLSSAKHMLFVYVSSWNSVHMSYVFTFL